MKITILAMLTLFAISSNSTYAHKVEVELQAIQDWEKFGVMAGVKIFLNGESIGLTDKNGRLKFNIESEQINIVVGKFNHRGFEHIIPSSVIGSSYSIRGVVKSEFHQSIKELVVGIKRSNENNEILLLEMSFITHAQKYLEIDKIYDVFIYVNDNENPYEEESFEQDFIIVGKNKIKCVNLEKLNGFIDKNIEYRMDILVKNSAGDAYYAHYLTTRLRLK